MAEAIFRVTNRQILRGYLCGMARNQFLDDAAFAKATASQGEVTETQNTDSKYESPLTNLIIMKKTKSRLQDFLILCSLMISISGLRDLEPKIK
mgnify:CR=1 FL=1